MKDCSNLSSAGSGSEPWVECFCSGRIWTSSKMWETETIWQGEEQRTLYRSEGSKHNRLCLTFISESVIPDLKVVNKYSETLRNVKVFFLLQDQTSELWNQKFWLQLRLRSLLCKRESEFRVQHKRLIEGHSKNHENCSIRNRNWT